MTQTQASRARTRRSKRSRTLKTLLPLLALIPRATHAQAKPLAAPASVQEMAHMRAGSYFYVQGGKVVRNNNDYLKTPQLFSLDLSTSWTTDSPPWKALSAGPAYNLFNGVASPDNKTLTTVFQQQSAQLLVDQYSVETDTWANSVVPTNENLIGIRPIMDQSSGLIYIAGLSNMVVLDPRTMEPKFLPINSTTMVSRSFSGAVYHPGRKSILYLGGFSPVGQFESRTYVTEYMIATNGWSTFMTQGVLPTARSDHCMAINEDGSKVVVFGGRIPVAGTTSVTSFTGTLYILDVATATWTPGLDSDPRLYMACTIVGDQFIAWGGYDGLNTIDGPPIIYSLSSNTWTNRYTAPASLANSARPTSGLPGGTSPLSPKPSSSSADSSSSSSNVGAILGGTLGSLCILAFAAVIYLFLKRKSDRAKYKTLAQQHQQHQQQQQRTSAQTEMASNPATSFDDDIPSLPLSPTPTTRSSTSATVVDVSKMSSQYNPTQLPIIRNPQDEGDRDHTVDYDPIGYIKVNPHLVFQSSMRGVYFVPQASSAVSGYHYPVPTQSPGIAPLYTQAGTPTYSQTVLVQPANFDPTPDQLQLQERLRQQQRQQQRLRQQHQEQQQRQRYGAK